jgi:hypothetical protein
MNQPRNPHPTYYIVMALFFFGILLFVASFLIVLLTSNTFLSRIATLAGSLLLWVSIYITFSYACKKNILNPNAIPTIRFIMLISIISTLCAQTTGVVKEILIFIEIIVALIGLRYLFKKHYPKT